MKKDKKEEFLEQLRLIPNISLACEKLGISRNSIYRWAKEDEVFKKRTIRALRLGNESVNDLAESAIIRAIKNGDIKACKYWLDNHKVNYIRPRLREMLEQIVNREAQTDDAAAKILKQAGIIPMNNKLDDQEDLLGMNDPDVLV